MTRPCRLNKHYLRGRGSAQGRNADLAVPTGDQRGSVVLAADQIVSDANLPKLEQALADAASNTTGHQPRCRQTRLLT